MLYCRHLMIAVSDVAEARRFYHEQLGLELVEEHAPHMFAVRADSMRFTVVGGGRRLAENSDEIAAVTLMIGTDNIERDVAQLRSRGVKFIGEIEEAPGFMRHIALVDPDSNELYLAQYERDPADSTMMNR